MKKIIYSLAFATTLVATSCSDEVSNSNNIKPDSEKEMISFSLSDEASSTRAGFTGADTRIVARFQSNEKVTSGTGRVLYTRTVMKAAKDKTGGADDFSIVTYYTNDNTRYWDDAFGRNGQISVYAVAIPNSTDDTKLKDVKLAGGTTWASESPANNTIDWDVTYNTSQTSETLKSEDLAYSNNIQKDGKNGRYVWDYTVKNNTENGYPADNGKLDGHSDGQLVFTQKAGALASDAGHFDKGHLMFKHSLSRLTVVLVPGTGFASERSTATDFKFNKIEGNIKSGNIELLSFPVHGKLDLDAGSWSIDNDGNQNITQMIGAAATGDTKDSEGNVTANGQSAEAAKYNATAETYLANRTYSAQMLPGKVFKANGTDNVMQFVIDDNTYYITEKMVYDALTKDESGTWYNTHKNNSDVLSAAGFNVGTSVTMAQGHNYTLTITVKKTGIANVTATLAPWVEVAGAMEVNNAHIKLTLSTSGETCKKNIDLYRLIDNNDNYDKDQYVFNYQGKRWFGNYSTDPKYKVTLNQTAYNATDNKLGVQTGSDSKKFWSTPWYFESNKEYYHFRTVNENTKVFTYNDANDNNSQDDGEGDCNDYFKIAAGPTDATDPHWGAPMKTVSGTTWLKYDDNGTLTNYSDDKGYEAHLHHAIGATETQIAIQELHMMSNINVVLKTPNNDGKVQLRKPEEKYTDDEIVTINEKTYLKSSVNMTDPQNPALYDDSNNEHNIEKKVGDIKEEAVETIVKITRIAEKGTVEMGRGVVTPTGAYTSELTMTNPSTYFKTEGSETNNYTYAVVPQSLSRNFSSTSDNDYVGIFIQTPDHNQYYVVKKLSEITASSVTDQRNQTKGQPIKRWYPGHTYTYTFTISKKGIDNITATVADWVIVTGQNINITLEN